MLQSHVHTLLRPRSFSGTCPLFLLWLLGTVFELDSNSLGIGVQASKLELWIMNAWLIKRTFRKNGSQDKASGFGFRIGYWVLVRHANQEAAETEMLMRSSLRLTGYFPSTQTMPQSRGPRQYGRMNWNKAEKRKVVVRRGGDWPKRLGRWRRHLGTQPESENPHAASNLDGDLTHLTWTACHLST